MKFLITLLVGVIATPIVYSQNVIQELSYKTVDSIVKQKVDIEGNYKAALPYAERLLDLAVNQNDSLYCDGMLYLGFVYEMLGAYAVADSLYQKTETHCKANLGEHCATYQQVTSYLAILNRAMGNFELAERYYQKNIKLTESLYGKKHIFYGHCLSGLGVLYRNLGRYAEAEVLYREYERIVKDTFGVEHAEYMSVLNNLAVLYNITDRLDEAEVLYKQILEINKKLKVTNQSSFVSTLNNLAHLYVSMDRFEEAEPLMLKVLDVIEQNIGKRNERYVKSKGILCDIYIHTKKYKQALLEGQEMLDLQKQLMGVKHQENARIYLVLFKACIGLHQLDQAEVYLEDALHILHAIGNEGNPLYPPLYISFGQLYKLTGNQEKGAYYLNKNIEVVTKYLGKQNSILARSYRSLAELELTQNKEAKALKSLYKSFASVHLDVPPYDSTWSIEFIEKLAEGEYLMLYHAIKNFHVLSRIAEQKSESSSDWLEKAYCISKANIDLIHNYKNDVVFDQDKLRILAELKYSVEHGLKAAIQLKDPRKVAGAFQLIEENKSILLADVLQSRQAQAVEGVPDSVIQKEKLLQNQLHKIKQLIGNARTFEEQKIAQNKFLQLQSQYVNFKQILEGKYPTYYERVYAKKTVEMASVQALLDQETLMLEYFIGKEKSYLFAITNEGVELLPIDVKYLELEKHVKALRAALTSMTKDKQKKEFHVENYIKDAFFLYRVLLKTVLEKYPNKTHLRIVADGALGHVPLGALLMQNDESKQFKDLSYLIRKYSISYSYSATVLETNHQGNRSNNGKILAIGADYNLSDPSKSEMRLYSLQNKRQKLQPLEMVESEIDVLKKDLKLEGLFALNESANEGFFKANASDFSMIHLAMHGLLNSKDPSMSSLVFTENGDSLEDNFLHAYEISNLNLNAELVVLSACETGYGKFTQGEGVLSLARNFMYAGVPSLIVSLWQVNDYTTSKLMQSFYQNLLAGMNKATALQQAKLSYLESADGLIAHPVFWAPFIQIGDSRPVLLQQQARGKWWLWGGVFSVFLFLLILLKKKGSLLA